MNLHLQVDCIMDYFRKDLNQKGCWKQKLKDSINKVILFHKGLIIVNIHLIHIDLLLIHHSHLILLIHLIHLILLILLMHHIRLMHHIHLIHYILMHHNRLINFKQTKYLKIQELMNKKIKWKTQIWKFL